MSNHNDYSPALEFHVNVPRRPDQTVYAKLGGGDLTSIHAEWLEVDEIVEARFNPYTFQNDIALLAIESSHQQVIQRAVRMPPKNAECFIYGYGSSSYAASEITSNIIRYGRVDPISHEKCEEILGRITAPSQGTGQFCAMGWNGVDGCNGE